MEGSFTSGNAAGTPCKAWYEEARRQDGCACGYGSCRAFEYARRVKQAVEYVELFDLFRFQKVRAGFPETILVAIAGVVGA